MAQFNLLPNVKLEYVKTQRTKRLLITISIIVSVVALFIFLLSLISVDVVQKKSLRDLDVDINKYSNQLKNVKDLDKILTVQNQLSTLTGLHVKEPVANRVFKYVSQVTPAQASLSNLAIDFDASTISFGGQAPSLDVISNFTDTLKSTKYTVDGSSDQKSAFSKVVLTGFGRTNNGASFTITTSFDPLVFDSKNDVTLVVPQSTQSSQSSIFGAGN